MMAYCHCCANGKLQEATASTAHAVTRQAFLFCSASNSLLAASLHASGAARDGAAYTVLSARGVGCGGGGLGRRLKRVRACTAHQQQPHTPTD